MLMLTAKLTAQAGKEQEFEAKMRLVGQGHERSRGNYAYSTHRSQDNLRVFVSSEECAG